MLMLLRIGGGRSHPVSIAADQPPQPRRPEQASTHLLCCAVMLIRTSALRPLLTVAVGLGSQITYTRHTYPPLARESQVAWRRGFRAAEHSLLRLLNRHTLSQIWLVIRPKRPRTLCTVHHRLLRVPGPLGVPLSTFQAMRAPSSDPNYGKA